MYNFMSFPTKGQMFPERGLSSMCGYFGTQNHFLTKPEPSAFRHRGKGQMAAGAVKFLAPMASGGVDEPHHVYSNSQKHCVSVRDAGRSEKREELVNRDL